MKTYDMYGTTLSIYEAAKSLEQLLHIKFEERESSYVGVYFTTGSFSPTDSLDVEKFEIRENFDPVDSQVSMKEYSEWPTLLDIGRTERSKEIYEILKNDESNFTLLKSETF